MTGEGSSDPTGGDGRGRLSGEGTTDSQGTDASVFEVRARPVAPRPRHTGRLRRRPAPAPVPRSVPTYEKLGAPFTLPSHGRNKCFVPT